jgi:thermitase
VLCATIARITGPANVPATSLVAKLPAGATVVPHHRFLAAAVEVRDFEPSNDPYRKYQYALDQLGAERAWNVSRGEGVTVALLDSQPAAGHPDLAAVSLHEGYEEVPAATHGTLMAGVLAAASGNAIGIAGLAPAAKVLAVPVCGPADDGGADTCPLFEVLRGIDRAWEGKASVVNLSLVGLSNPLLERAVARLERLGLLVVAAVGNEGEATPRYPAAYPTVIGVGAVDRDGAISARSNTGLAVELFAPGVEILSTRPPDRFAFGDGTSLAAAHVSGALAVLLGSGLEPSDARQRLRAATSAVADPRAAGAGRLGPLCDALAAAGRACAD